MNGIVYQRVKAPPSPYVSVKSVGKHSTPRFSGQHQSAAGCPYKGGSGVNLSGQPIKGGSPSD